MTGQQRPYLAGRQGEQLTVAERFDAGRAHLTVEHRQLAEDVTRAEARQGDRTPVRVLASDPKAAVTDDVTGVGVIALVEDAGAGREGASYRDSREALQLPFLEVGEERHAAQQRNRPQPLLTICHRLDYPCTRGRTLDGRRLSRK